MRYVIVGAGAVGGSVAGALLRQGEDVALVARGPHGRAIAERGLTFATADGVSHHQVPVAEDAAALRLTPSDVLFLAVKTQHVPPLLADLASLEVGKEYAGGTLPIFCAQNGVVSQAFALRSFDRVYAVTVILGAAFVEPGHIDAFGSPLIGDFDIGRFPAADPCRHLEAVCRDLTSSGIRATARHDVMPWKYAKLRLNLSNSVDALFEPREDPVGREAKCWLIAESRREADRCFVAASIEVIPEEKWLAYHGDVAKMVPVDGAHYPGSSSWQSLARGTGSIEADYLNGEIVMLGRLTGVPTPVNRALQMAANIAARTGQKPRALDPVAFMHRVAAGTGSAE